MEENKIHLSPIVIAELYSSSLVVLEEMVGNRQTAVGTEPVAIGKKSVLNEEILTKILPKKEIEKPSLPTAEKPVPVMVSGKNAIQYLGGFSKKISIILEEHFQPHISDADLAFLTKLLEACKLSLQDVAIVNVVYNGQNAMNIWKEMPAEKMILFGVDPGSIGLPFRVPYFQLQPWAENLFLTAPSLDELQNRPEAQAKELKKQLWVSLKKMFGV